jgi:hypothetical protein
MNIHNAFKECPLGEEHLMRNVKAHVTPNMVALIDKLTTKNPNWQFISAGYSNSHADGNTYYSRFTIEELGEELGWIDITYSWRTSGEYSYIFDCPRLKAKRQRKACSETKDINKAVKSICAHMYGTTSKERMAAAVSKADAAVKNNANRAHYSLRNVREKLADELVTYAVSDLDRFLFAIPKNMHEVAATLPDKISRAKASDTVQNVLLSKSGATVMELGSAFMVRYDKDPSIYHTYTLEELPEAIKGDVAMLKLVSVGGFIENVGARSGNNEFYVVSGSI